jgi:myo-inositol-1(or 4)-monophosphatase
MSSSTEEELDKIHAFAIQLGKDAGAMLQTAANARIAGKLRSKSVEKASAVDIVTDTDEGKWRV